MVAIYDFYETENECNVAVVCRIMRKGIELCTAAECFHKIGQAMYKFETKGRTFVRIFIPGAGRFYGAGKELLPVICIDTGYHECAGVLLEKKQPGIVSAWPFARKLMVVRLVIISLAK